MSIVSGKNSQWVTGGWKFFILRISAWRANPELGHLGMFLFWSCFHCVWRYGEWEGGEGVREKNKAKLNPGVKMGPRSKSDPRKDWKPLRRQHSRQASRGQRQAPESWT